MRLLNRQQLVTAGSGAATIIMVDYYHCDTEEAPGFTIAGSNLPAARAPSVPENSRPRRPRAATRGTTSPGARGPGGGVGVMAPPGGSARYRAGVRPRSAASSAPFVVCRPRPWSRRTRRKEERKGITLIKQLWYTGESAWRFLI